MSRIVVNDAGLLAQFQVAAGETEICDPSGKLLGTYKPELAIPSAPYGIKSPYSAEELERRAQEPGMPLTEFGPPIGMAHWEYES